MRWQDGEQWYEIQGNAAVAIDDPEKIYQAEKEADKERARQEIEQLQLRKEILRAKMGRLADALAEVFPGVSFDDETVRRGGRGSGADYIDGDREYVTLDGHYSKEQICALAEWMNFDA